MQPYWQYYTWWCSLTRIIHLNHTCEFIWNKDVNCNWLVRGCIQRWGTNSRLIVTLGALCSVQEGYRTLCVAYKILSAEEYAQADAGLREARLALQDREGKLMAVYNQVETGMSLIGATAVEDRLVITKHNHTALFCILLLCILLLSFLPPSSQ